MFVNFSNHPHGSWDASQLEAAGQYGDIVDVAFPEVPPLATREEIYIKALEIVENIIELNPDIVMCQGESTFCYRVVELLKQHNIKVVAACTKRIVTEIDNKKITEFKFEQLREY